MFSCEPHNALYRAAQVRELDRQAIAVQGIPGLTLMQRAGAFSFRILHESWPLAERIIVICGLGNNAGDGYVIARLAHEAGLAVKILQIGDASRLQGDALQCANDLAAAGNHAEPFSTAALNDADVLVDAVFGTGLDREVSGPWGEALAAINAASAPVLAVDIPSGLNADTGSVMGVAVEAELTPTFIGMKQGLLTGVGPDHCGRVLFDDLGVPEVIYDAVTPAAIGLDLYRLPDLLPRRRRSAHKGNFGHVLIVGGDTGYAGAARMAAEAAARCGAGLVSLATRVEHAPLVSMLRPEIMSHGIESVAALGPLLERASVIGIGPGLGQGEWGGAMLARVLETDLPLVVDADALNLLASEPARRDNWVLTPHPGEAARLLGASNTEVQADRFAAATAIQARYGGVCVLKGAGTLVATGDDAIGLCDAGNPGMASGGMGDVLTGVISALLAQELDSSDAAALGTCVHAQAGDRAASAGGERGLLATDLLAELRAVVNLDADN